MTTTRLQNWRDRIKGRLKLKWALQCFRFFFGVGKPERALEYLARIPLPEETAAETFVFRLADDALWRRYFDQKGNFIPLTKLRLLRNGVIVLLTGAAVWTGFSLYRDITTSRKIQPGSGPSPISSQWNFLLTNRDTVSVDMNREPKVADGQLQVPTIPKSQDTTVFRSASHFKGDAIALNDRLVARSFVNIQGDTMYFVRPLDSALQGNWIWPRVLALTKIDNDAAPTAVNLLSLKIKAPIKLRQKPSPDGKLIKNMQPGQSVQLVKLGPLAAGFVWIYVAYEDSLRQTHEGWIAAYSSTKEFIEVAQP